eukprot:TRINITY_DN18168_c0_g1_i5.p1 TRINITY_DN18168_c0_g1~~TRINITY_DN18168_c0_g1_i5.p1  ORF type:complete len:278 (+),score=62.13 TRINITY_DN18168_c0_g1_i5:191-1024(+)
MCIRDRNKASDKTAFLREGVLVLEKVEADPANDADALWRIESVEEEFDVLEFFYPSVVVATVEGHAPFDKPRGEGVNGPRQLRAGDAAEGAAPELTGDYDLMDDRGHWRFEPVDELKPGKYHIKSASNPEVALDKTMFLGRLVGNEDAKRFKWRLSPLGNGYYCMFNKATKKSLDGGSEETESGAKPSLARKDVNPRSQQWKVIPHAVDVGMYHICCHANFLALDAGRQGEEGAVTLLKDFSPDEPSHKWEIVPCADGENSCASDAESDEEIEEACA